MQRSVRTRQGSKHDKTGCLTCRYRRKKCVDNVFPVCGTCARLNYRCVRQPAKEVVPVDNIVDDSQDPRDIASDTNVIVTKPSPQVVPLGLGSPGAVGLCSGSSQKRHAMRYYISVLTTHLTVSEEFNSFLTAFLPMAMESTVLSEVLLALATGHLAIIDKSQKVAALESRSAAISQLATAITAPSSDLSRHETKTAACLAFVIYEAGIGDHGAWYTHLKGTQHLIMSAEGRVGGRQLTGPQAFKTSTEGQWILRNFAYHDVIGSVTLGTTPLLSDEILDGITDVIDSCLGVATELLGVLAQISCLDKDHHANTDSESFQHKYSQLEERLLSWQCHPDADVGLAALAYAYCDAILIVLYRMKRRRLRSERCFSMPDSISYDQALAEVQSKVQEQVVKGLQHISDIPVESAPESALLFPVFIIGGETLAQDQIDTVRTRLRHMTKKRQFRNLTRAWEVLEDLWEWRKTPLGANADWTQVLAASNQPQLLLT